MNTYQKEHLDTYRLVMDYLASHPAAERRYLLDLTADYMDFRKRLEEFQQMYVGGLCSGKCFLSSLSACCTRDSIVVYFADVLINCLYSNEDEISDVIELLKGDNKGHRCIYLTQSGCRWRISPIVCAMFLCDEAETVIRDGTSQAAEKWRAFEDERKLYTWPDRPVLFDDLECRFIEGGLNSPLMHLNSSPGLLALKHKAGLIKQPFIPKIS